MYSFFLKKSSEYLHQPYVFHVYDEIFEIDDVKLELFFWKKEMNQPKIGFSPPPLQLPEKPCIFPVDESACRRPKEKIPPYGVYS